MADFSFSMEKYDGFWNGDAERKADPAVSDLRQYRVALGAAKRLSHDWQGGISIPYVWNVNKYAETSSRSSGPGDSSAALWFEAVDDRSIWKLRTWKDFVPSVTAGLTLTIPTGISPYDDIDDSFDVTGRGFYRLDGNVLIEKTMIPWNISLLLSQGTHFERTVNREYGKYVEPYRKKLGDRFSASLSAGWRYFIGTAGDSVTLTASAAHLREADAVIDGKHDAASGFRKNSLGAGATYASTDHDWSFRLGWTHSIRKDGWGENFPITDIYTVGVRRVFR